MLQEYSHGFWYFSDSALTKFSPLLVYSRTQLVLSTFLSRLPWLSCSCSHSTLLMFTPASWEAAAIWCLCWEQSLDKQGPLWTMLVCRIPPLPGVCCFLWSSEETHCILYSLSKNPALAPPPKKCCYNSLRGSQSFPACTLSVSKRFSSSILFSCFCYSICCPELWTSPSWKWEVEAPWMGSRASRGQDALMFSIPTVLMALFSLRIISSEAP